MQFNAEQLASLATAEAEWQELRTKPATKEEGIEAAKKFYELKEIEFPETVIFAPNPNEALRVATLLWIKENNNITPDSYSYTTKYSDDIHTVAGCVLQGDLLCQQMPTLDTQFKFGLLNKNAIPEYQVNRAIAESCGWLMPFDTLCVIVPKASVLKYNEEGQLHCVTGPAYVMGETKKYYFNGTLLEHRYARPVSQWEPEWLLDETNAESRRILIQGLGYDRILESLGAEVLDRFEQTSSKVTYDVEPMYDDGGCPYYPANAEARLEEVKLVYELVKVSADVDVEPIVGLKMVCPTTGHIHFIRTSPDMKTAEEALTKYYHGHDPRSFVIQA